MLQFYVNKKIMLDFLFFYYRIKSTKHCFAAQIRTNLPKKITTKLKEFKMNKNRPNNRHGHHNNNRRPALNINKNTVLDSSGPCGRIRGNVQQLIDKYLSAAKDARGQNDKILYETCMQHAEHYTRILNSINAQFNQQRPTRQPDQAAEEKIEKTEDALPTQTVENIAVSEEEIPQENKLNQDLPFMQVDLQIEQTKPAKSKNKRPKTEKTENEKAEAENNS